MHHIHLFSSTLYIYLALPSQSLFITVKVSKAFVDDLPLSQRIGNSSASIFPTNIKVSSGNISGNTESDS